MKKYIFEQSLTRVVFRLYDKSINKLFVSPLKLFCTQDGDDSSMYCPPNGLSNQPNMDITPGQVLISFKYLENFFGETLHMLAFLKDI